MKKLVLLAVGFAGLATSCTVLNSGSSGYDDVYSSSANTPVETQQYTQKESAQKRPIQSTEANQNQAGSEDQQNYNSDNQGGNTPNQPDQSMATQSSTDGNTYITNNYYDDEYDYYYSSRIRRFHNYDYGWNYYDPWYTNEYWYSYNPFAWGVSIYMGYGWLWNDPFYRPYFSYAPGCWGYYGGGFYGGYYGYNHGYWNDYYGYGDNYYNSYDDNKTHYYGHRDAIGGGYTGGGHRSTGSTGGTSGLADNKNKLTLGERFEGLAVNRVNGNASKPNGTTSRSNPNLKPVSISSQNNENKDRGTSRLGENSNVNNLNNKEKPNNGATFRSANTMDKPIAEPTNRFVKPNNGSVQPTNNGRSIYQKPVEQKSAETKDYNTNRNNGSNPSYYNYKRGDSKEQPNSNRVNSSNSSNYSKPAPANNNTKTYNNSNNQRSSEGYSTPSSRGSNYTQPSNNNSNYSAPSNNNSYRNSNNSYSTPSRSSSSSSGSSYSSPSRSSSSSSGSSYSSPSRSSSGSSSPSSSSSGSSRSSNSSSGRHR